MFKIIANVGDDLVVGTHKGNVGIMSRCIMEDEGLVESKELELREAEPGRDKYRMLVYEPTLAEPFVVTGPEFAIPYSVVDVDLKLWRYGDFLLRVGYSAEARTWVKSEVSEAMRRMYASNRGQVNE